MCPELKILKRLEANFERKNCIEDPMPQFTTAAQRMLDLCEKRLHPAYKRYLNVPRRRPPKCGKKSFQSLFDPTDIPVQIRMNKPVLEMKNMYFEYKRIEPPRNLPRTYLRRGHFARQKVPIIPDDVTQASPRKKAVYDTLYQKDIKF